MSYIPLLFLFLSLTCFGSVKQGEAFQPSRFRRFASGGLLSSAPQLAAIRSPTDQGPSMIPLWNNLLVRVHKQQQTPMKISPGGIILPVEATKPPLSQAVWADVVAVGAEANLSGAVSAGDVVVFSRFDGTDVGLGGEVFTVLRDDCILLSFKRSSNITIASAECMGDSILVKPSSIKPPDKDAPTGSIVTVQTERRQVEASTAVGTVIRTGGHRKISNREAKQGKEQRSDELNSGDVVRYLKSGGHAITIDQEDCVVLGSAVSDILLRVQEAGAVA